MAGLWNRATGILDGVPLWCWVLEVSRQFNHGCEAKTCAYLPHVGAVTLPFTPLESPSLPDVALLPNITRRNNARMACTSAVESPASVNLSYACGVSDPS
jgi:hypothetical protein